MRLIYSLCLLLPLSYIPLSISSLLSSSLLPFLPPLLPSSSLHLHIQMLWINRSTVPNAVFAGTMPIMAAVKLSTERPIVNHPHFEHSEARHVACWMDVVRKCAYACLLRIRTKLVYSMYSRKPPTEIHAILANMGVHFVIVDHSWCARDYRLGCSLYQVWDIEDVMNRGRPTFCEMISDQEDDT